MEESKEARLPTGDAIINYELDIVRQLRILGEVGVAEWKERMQTEGTPGEVVSGGNVVGSESGASQETFYRNGSVMEQGQKKPTER